MEKQARELEFIGKIKRDGSGVTKVSKRYLKAMLENPLMKDTYFKLHCLSLSEKTFIAFNINVFIVRLK